MIDLNYYYMSLALKEAQIAFDMGEIPVGAIVVANHQIIGKGHNLVEQLKDPTAHAEMIAITSACNYKGSKLLEDATLYVTLEPCCMCAGALFWSRIQKVVYGARDIHRGFLKKQQNALHPKTEIEGGISDFECEQLLKDFFQKLRK